MGLLGFYWHNSFYWECWIVTLTLANHSRRFFDELQKLAQVDLTIIFFPQTPSQERAYQRRRMEARNRWRTPAVPNRAGQDHPSPSVLPARQLKIRRSYSGSGRKPTLREEYLPDLSAWVEGYLGRLLQRRWRMHCYRLGKDCFAR